MADVVISSAHEDEATAGQVEEAFARAGYDVWRPEGGSGAANSDAVTEQIVAAKAVIVIWSGAAAASEWVRAEANVARALKKLVQVSADGNSPPAPFDATQVSAISDSEAVRAGVAALAGTPVPREPEPQPAPAPELSDPAPLPPSGPAPVVAASSLSAPAPRRRGPSLGLIIVLLFVLIVLGAAGYVFWQRSRPPASAPAPDAVETNLATPAEPAGPDLPQDVPLPAGADGSAPLPVDESLNGLAPPPEADAQVPAQPQARREAPPRRAEPRAPRQRIRKENSQVMEDYCAYAGRNTPQCRRFRQSN